MWLFLAFGAFVLAVGVGGVAYVVVRTRDGEQRFVRALAARPHLTLKGSRVRSVVGLQLASSDSEYELRSSLAPNVRLRPAHLTSRADPTDTSPALDPSQISVPTHRELPAQSLLVGFIDGVAWPSRLELFRGTQAQAVDLRQVNGRPELALQPPLADDVLVRGDAPCPDGVREALLAFLQPGTLLCLEPAGITFQVRRGGDVFLDEAALPDIEATFARAAALRTALLG